MRHYPSDSVEAVARVVSLALLADGGLDNSELRTLERNEILERLQIGDDTFDRVLHEFCDDVLLTARAPNVGQIELDSEAIDGLLSDVRSPALQKQTLRAILDIVAADQCLNGGEAVLVSRAMSRWQLDLCELADGDPWRAECSSPSEEEGWADLTPQLAPSSATWHASAPTTSPM